MYSGQRLMFAKERREISSRQEESEEKDEGLTAAWFARMKTRLTTLVVGTLPFTCAKKETRYQSAGLQCLVEIERMSDKR